MIDHRNRIAELMALRDRGLRRRRPTATMSTRRSLRQIALLWQTRVLRRERLYVADEVETALSLSARRVPAGAARRSTSAGTARWASACRAFLRPGSWIGGDRDGNPNSSPPIADARRSAESCEAVLGYYLDAVHALGAELSISTEHAAVSDELLALAERERRHRARAATTSRIAARCRASMRGWRRRICALTGKPAPRPGALDGRGLCRSAGVPPRSGRRSRTRWPATATGRWRRAARSGG